MKSPHPKPKRSLKREKYCSYCGSQLEESLVGAETCYEEVYFAGEILRFKLARAYDFATGERNYCKKYICPNIKDKKWYQALSPHDEFTINKLLNSPHKGGK